MPSEHSKYSPSGLARAIYCPGSFLAQQGIPNESSPAADRGTECHDWAEKLIMAEDPSKEMPPAFKEGYQEDCTRKMVGMALNLIDQWGIESGDYRLGVEEKVSLEWLNAFRGKSTFDFSGVWGTADVTVFQPGAHRLAVIDYKAGVGPVDVQDPYDCIQFMIYALGALRHRFLEAPYTQIKEVVLGVAQPRVYDELQTLTMSVDDLVKWALDTLLPALELMSKPGAPFVTGEKQCKWCRAKGQCPEKTKEVMDLLDTAPLKTHKVLSTLELSEAALKVKELESWLKSFKKVLLTRMQDGENVPGFKLVKGRKGNRKWILNEEGEINRKKVENFLRGRDLKKADIITEQLLSPAQAKKLIEGKLDTPRLQNAFKKLLTQTDGKVTYAPESDKREAIIPESPLDLLDDKPKQDTEEVWEPNQVIDRVKKRARSGKVGNVVITHSGLVTCTEETLLPEEEEVELSMEDLL